MAEFCELTIEVLVDRVKSFLELLLVKLADGVMRRVVVNVGQQNRLRERRLDVLARATVAVSAGTNLSKYKHKIIGRNGH